MRTLGRILFLFLSIFTGAWFLFSGFVVVKVLDNPDAVPRALGAAVVPLIFFIICVSCFRKLAPTSPTKEE